MKKVFAKSLLVAAMFSVAGSALAVQKDITVTAKNLMFAQTTKGVLETGIYRGVVSIYLSQDI
jgi:flagellar basal body rod protein FlgC